MSSAYDALKSKSRRDAEARLRAKVKARDAALAAAEKPKAAKAAPKAAPAKAAGPSYNDGIAKGFVTGRDLERARIREVAAVAKDRGQAIEGMRLLAETDLSAADIIAKLKSRNLLVEAAKARYGEAAR